MTLLGFLSTTASRRGHQTTVNAPRKATFDPASVARATDWEAYPRAVKQPQRIAVGAIDLERVETKGLSARKASVIRAEVAREGW